MNWFQDLTGLDSDDPGTVRARIAVEGRTLICPNGRRLSAGRLEMPSLADLRRSAIPDRGPTRVREVVADVQDLHRDPANEGAVFQVASQFNLLEMASPEVTPDDGIARYAGDPTQGPACAIACGAGTLWRNYFASVGGGVGQSADRQIDTLADLGAALGNDGTRFWEMRNGYALATAEGLGEIAALGQSRRAELAALLRVGVQAETEVTLPGAGHHVTQVYCSALPVAYGAPPAGSWEAFARLILDAAYEATFHVAAGRGGRLFLTRLGGGVFGNRPEWISDAIRRALGLFAGAGLDVALVSYGRSDPNSAAIAAGALAGNF